MEVDNARARTRLVEAYRKKNIGGVPGRTSYIEWYKTKPPQPHHGLPLLIYEWGERSPSLKG